MTPFDLILQILGISPRFHLSVKFDANSFIDGYLQLRGFGCKIPILANFEKFWGILTPEIVKFLF